jgi:hypothetical protein
MGERVEVLPVDGPRGPSARAFLEFPYGLYRDCPQWVPPLRGEVRALLERRHPFFGHSPGEFFLARRGGATVGRVLALENTRFNSRHDRRFAWFYLFECLEDPEAAAALLAAVERWARARGLTAVAGPGGMGAGSGAGVLVDGFEHRAAMTMMGWNHPYYPALLEGAGYASYKNYYSARLEAATFRMPERVRRLAEKTLERGRFRLQEFKSKRELLALAPRLGQIYNTAIAASHPDAYPYTEAELGQVIRQFAQVAEPGLIKVIAYDSRPAGFVFGFPDLSAALQRARGRLAPWNLLDLAAEYRRTDSLIINGAGILPEYQRLGGNALLYHTLELTANTGRFRYGEMTQIADTTALMLSDMQTLGGRIYKTHRVYKRDL